MIQFKKAERKKAKLRLAFAGPAGSGKTYSALLIAFGLGGRTAMIDTERGSGELYAHLGEYDVCSLEAPFTPEKYVEAIRAAEGAGYDNIIIDSLSHAWAGPGGVLDIHGHAADKGGNSWAAWRQVTPRHNELVDAMLLSRCHIIATLRSKMEHVQVVENGKTVIKKVGMNPIQRDGLEYEFTVFLDLDHNHTASASKDRTGLFDGQLFKPTPDIGRKLLEWLNAGVEPKAWTGQRNFVVVDGRPAGAGENAGVDIPVNRTEGIAGADPAPWDDQGSWGEDHTFTPGTNSGNLPRPNNQSPATQAQIRKIFATAGDAGLGETMLSQFIEQETGKTSAKDLTKPEASRVIDLLLGMANGKRNPKPEQVSPPPRAAGGSRMRLF